MYHDRNRWFADQTDAKLKEYGNIKNEWIAKQSILHQHNSRTYAIYTLLLEDSQQSNPKFKSLIILKMSCLLNPSVYIGMSCNIYSRQDM